MAKTPHDGTLCKTVEGVFWGIFEMRIMIVASGGDLFVHGILEGVCHH